MPDFIAKYSTPVRYLPGHFNEREVTELPINAPDATSALIHSLQVVQGVTSMPEIILEDHVPPAPLSEAPNDPPTEVINNA